MNKDLNKPEKVKCIYCNEPIKVKEWAGVYKRGYICKKISCILKLRKELENNKMAELKTLKDIFKSWDDKREFKPASYNCYCGACQDGYFDSCDVIKIKQEAIKWIKEDLKQIGDSGAEKGLLIRWMNRFNLTEEDLK